MPYKNKEDQAAAAKRHYEKNKQAIKDRARAFGKVLESKLTEYVWALKSKPCTDCGVSYPHYVMDFDHVGDDKVANVSDLMRRGNSMKKLQAEIDKCELVCSNCHRERTWVRANPA